MRVEMLKTASAHRVNAEPIAYGAGQVADIPADLGQAWLKAGICRATNRKPAAEFGVARRGETTSKRPAARSV